MTSTELIIFLWFVPVVLQIGIPLALFSGWVLMYAVRKVGGLFSKEETLTTQLAKA